MYCFDCTCKNLNRLGEKRTKHKETEKLREKHKNRNTGYPAHEPPRSENIKKKNRKKQKSFEKNIKNRNTGYPAHEPPRSENRKNKQKNFEKNKKTEIQDIQPKAHI